MMTFSKLLTHYSVSSVRYRLVSGNSQQSSNSHQAGEQGFKSTASLGEAVTSIVAKCLAGVGWSPGGCTKEPRDTRAAQSVTHTAWLYVGTARAL